MSLKTFASALIGFCPALFASAQLWTSPANVLVFGDFDSTNTEVNADLWVGGNMTVANFSVGKDLSGVSASHPSLVVGNDLTWTNGQVFHGSAHVGGTVHQAPDVPNGSLYSSLPPGLDFGGLYSQAQALSASLAASAATGSAVNQFGTLTFAGDSGLNVFHLTPAELQNIHTFKFTAPDDALLVVNVSGSSYTHQTWTGINPSDLIGGLTYQNILFNFYEADQIHLSTFTGFGGSLLAPDAHLEAAYGSFRGQLVANSYEGNFEFYDFPLIPTQFTAVPEPAVYGPLGILALSGLIVRRFARKKQTC